MFGSVVVSLSDVSLSTTEHPSLLIDIIGVVGLLLLLLASTSPHPVLVAAVKLFLLSLVVLFILMWWGNGMWDLRTSKTISLKKSWRARTMPVTTLGLAATIWPRKEILNGRATVPIARRATRNTSIGTSGIIDDASTSVFVNSRTLMGCCGFRNGCPRYHHQVSFGSAASYLI